MKISGLNTIQFFQIAPTYITDVASVTEVIDPLSIVFISMSSNQRMYFKELHHCRSK